MADEPGRALPPSAEQLLHEKPLRAAVNHETAGPPHPNDYPNPHDPLRERQRDATAATSRRLEREEISATSGLVAGHDFKREHQERGGRSR